MINGQLTNNSEYKIEFVFQKNESNIEKCMCKQHQFESIIGIDLRGKEYEKIMRRKDNVTNCQIFRF